MLAVSLTFLTPLASGSSFSRETIAATLAPGSVVQRTSRHSFGASEAVYVTVTAAGVPLSDSGRGRVVDYAGRGVIVRLQSARGAGPLRLRMASVRARAVRVVVELRWGA